PEVRAGVGDVIDQRDLEARLLGSAGAVGRIRGGGGERQRFDELAAADLALLELGELVGDETFHDYPPSRSAPERVFGFRRRDLHVVAERIEHIPAALAAAPF